MKTGLCLWVIGILWALPVWGIGYVYTGVGGDGRELMEITSVVVDVDIQDRLAVTRTDQVFTNRSDRQVEGIYEFALPVGAVISDLVLWIGDKRVQGMIMEKEAARQSYDAIVRRNVDPALVEQVDEERFRLSIFPFPARESRRVELEYMQVLKSRGGTAQYRFPLAAESAPAPVVGSLVLRAMIGGQHPFEVSAAGIDPGIVEVEREDRVSAEVFYADESIAAESDFELIIDESGEKYLPTLLSHAPGRGEFGYYALWLPPLVELLQADLLPRAITFVIDVSSSMRGDKLAGVKGALGAAVEALGGDDLFNVVVFSNRATAFADGPVAADSQNREAALDFVRQQGALGATNYEAALEMALGQRFPAGRRNHVIFLTDGFPTLGETDLASLSRMVEETAGDDIRLFTIGVGDEVDGGFLRALAEDHRGESRLLNGEEDIEEELRRLFEEFSRPIFLPEELVFEGMEVYDVFPARSELLAIGQELFQVGRYPTGGDITLRLAGRVQEDELSLEYPLAFAAADPETAGVVEDTVLFFDDFGDSTGGWIPVPGMPGRWELDRSDGVFTVSGVNGISRAFTTVDARSYTIETRMRFGGHEGKVVFMMADRSETYRVDLMAGSGVRLQAAPGSLFSVPFGIVAGVWYDVRVEVGDGTVTTYVEGVRLHHQVSLSGAIPDGRIGIGSYGNTHRAEFDYVRVLKGAHGDYDYRPTELTPVARLWAHQKVQALEGEIARYGEQQEMLDDILDLGLTYRLVTRRTALFAPDENVVVDPQPGDGDGDGWSATAVLDSVATVMWLGRSFELRDGVWVDAAFAPGMEIARYVPETGQPAVLEDFARLGEHLIVVADEVAYEVEAEVLEAQPVLAQNAPNPFNAVTVIRFWIPPGVESERIELAIYNLAGQWVRSWGTEEMVPGENALVWDGRDDEGRQLASGVYICRLGMEDVDVSRRMLLLR